MDRTRRLILWGVCAVVLVLLAARFFEHTADDAYVTFRYADNWARGLGPVFNAGERVEGYSNFLWVALLSLLRTIGIAPVPSAAVLGLLSSLLLVALCVRHLPPAGWPWLGAAAALWVAVSPPLAVWSTAGLETPFFALLVGALVLEAAHDAEHGALGWRCALLGALVSLTRPEGIGVAVLVAVLWAAVSRGGRASALLRPLARYATVVAAIFLPYSLWRFAYYGSWLPNTFHVKVGVSATQVLRGLEYVHAYFWPAGYVLLALAGVGALRGVPRRFCRMLAGFVCGWSIYVVGVGGDGLVMFRFMVPLIAPLALLATTGLIALTSRWQQLRAGRWAIACVVAAIAVLVSLDAFRGLALEGVRQEIREVEAWRSVGEWLAANAPSDASVAMLPAGAIPYYSGLEAIDLLGLTDAHIARRDMPLGAGQAGHEKYDTEYVLGRAPDYVVVGVYELLPDGAPRRFLVQPFYAAERSILEHPAFRARYRFREVRLPAGRFAIAERLNEGSAAVGSTTAPHPTGSETGLP